MKIICKNSTLNFARLSQTTITSASSGVTLGYVYSCANVGDTPTMVADAKTCCIEIACAEGDTFETYTRGGGKPYYGAIFVDSDGSALQLSCRTTTWSQYNLTAPNGAVKVLMSCVADTAELRDENWYVKY